MNDVDTSIKVSVEQPFTLKRLFGALCIIGTGILSAWWASPVLNMPATYMLAILVVAALLWVTELIPLFATSLLIIGSQIILLSNPGDWAFLQDPRTEAIPFRNFLYPVADPIIILFLGGFILAKVGVKVNVDQYLTSVVLRVFGRSAKKVLLGVILCTTVFGMWISNTATTAMMITLSGSFLASVPSGNPFRKGITLAIPFAAGIGGLLTPISSPPNALAVGMLANAGIRVGFLHWILVMTPLVIALLCILYQLIWFHYKPKQPLTLSPVTVQPFSKRGKFVIVVFFLTVFLWLTDTIHGIPAAVVALLPVFIFTATGLLTAKEFNRLDWNILFVIAGGLALGEGMALTGLDKVIAAMLPVGSSYIVIILFMITLLLGTFMSNTTTAVLFIPMAISMAEVLEDVNLKFMAIGLAVMAGSSMSLPISTPPNAIAYATGELDRRDFLVNGAVIGICSLLLTYGYFWLLVYFGFW
jgi:sodium-dependent dicarboxylate transporter 2/3/5